MFSKWNSLLVCWLVLQPSKASAPKNEWVVAAAAYVEAQVEADVEASTPKNLWVVVAAAHVDNRRRIFGSVGRFFESVRPTMHNVYSLPP